MRAHAVSMSRCRGTLKANHINRLHEDGASDLGGVAAGDWWCGSRALRRSEDLEVDEPGTWDMLVSCQHTLCCGVERETYRS